MQALKLFKMNTNTNINQLLEKFNLNMGKNLQKMK